MLQKITTFIKYHNALPFGALVLFLGFGAAFAANEDLRETAAAAILSSTQTVVKVDNSLILSVNLEQFTPSAQINTVTEDAENYYVSYTLYTIDLQNGVWNTVSRGENVTVSKTLLGNNDLGLFVAKQIKEVTDRQVQYLKEVQDIEQGKGVTEKTIATTYSGLIGKFLDPKEETFPGYQPVIPPEVKTVVNTDSQETPTVASAPVSAPVPTPTTSTVNTANTSSDTVPPTVTINGNNPATIEIRKGYSDNGVTVTDNVDQNLGVSVTVDGVSVSEIQINTSIAGEHTIVYTATDSAGNSTSATRTVIIEDPNPPIQPPQEITATTTEEIAATTETVSSTTTDTSTVSPESGTSTPTE
ncbi:MAG: DUF5011 domain-containing protein [Parcubacteria group bacterium]|nr:DUF5011 domain-containing protein [Parcubacteria group bacterium]